MSAEKDLFHCSNPTCERWKQFFEPLTLDGLPLVCGLCGHKLGYHTNLGERRLLKGRVKVDRYPHLKREDVLIVLHKQIERLPGNIKRRVKQRP